MKVAFACFGLFAFCVLILLAPVRADRAVIHRLVLYPNGRPAVGAAVTLRVVKWRTSTDGDRTAIGLVSEVKTSTGPDGWFTLNCDYSWSWRDWNFTPAYLMVDAKDCNLLISNIAGWMEARDNLTPITLAADSPIRGTVVDATGSPMEGVTVTEAQIQPMGFVHFPVNVAYAGISTVGLDAKTAADGSYLLRGVSVEDTVNYALAFPQTKTVPLSVTSAGLNIAATAAKDIGSVRYEGAALLPDKPITPLVVEPVSTVSGHIVNPTTGSPVAGAAVQLVCFPAEGTFAVPMSTTDAHGNFHFDAVPPSSEYVAHAVLDGSTDGWEVVGGDGTATLAPKQYTDVALRMYPLTPISGHVIDSADGKPEVTPAQLALTYTDPLTKPAPAGGMRIPPAWSAYLQTDAKGLFSVSAPAGELIAGVNGIGFEGKQNVRVSADRTSAANRDIEVVADRNPGFLISVLSDSKDGIPVGDAVEVKSTDAKSDSWRMVAGPLMYRFFPTANWGDKASVRIISGVFNKSAPVTEVVPWQEIVADIKAWPTIVIRVPQNPSVRSGKLP